VLRSGSASSGSVVGIHEEDNLALDINLVGIDLGLGRVESGSEAVEERRDDSMRVAIGTGLIEGRRDRATEQGIDRSEPNSDTTSSSSSISWMICESQSC